MIAALVILLAAPNAPILLGDCGPVYRGIPSVCEYMGFDPYAEYPVDAVAAGSTIAGNGTAADPWYVDASALRTDKLKVTGEYVIVAGGYIDYPNTDGPALSLSGCTHCVVRDMEIFGSDENFNAGADSAVSTGSGNAFLRVEVHGFGDRRDEAGEQDYHGLKIIGHDLWVLDSDIYDVSGDSIQCGDASRGSCERVYIGGNRLHDNHENGVDIKDSHDVVVSGNIMHGFPRTQSSSGEAIVIHDDAYDARVYANTISDAVLGIVSSGVSGHVIEGNNIKASGDGIQLRGTTGLVVRHNVITAPRCVNNQGSAHGDIQSGCTD